MTLRAMAIQAITPQTALVMIIAAVRSSLMCSFMYSISLAVSVRGMTGLERQDSPRVTKRVIDGLGKFPGKFQDNSWKFIQR